MNNCFIMQPFDNDKFDRRFEEVIGPAIESCGFFPYRVDEDNAVIIPIETIEEGIRTSEFCIAEITTDNPNVWYELGYAIAFGKKVIMLCSDERTTPFPFDVRHRSILTYKTKSLNDFRSLGVNLENRIRGLLGKFPADNNLTEAEMFMLRLISRNINTPFEVTSKDRIVVGSDEDALQALRNLVKKGYVEYIYSVDDQNRMNNFYRPTVLAEQTELLVMV